MKAVAIVLLVSLLLPIPSFSQNPFLEVDEEYEYVFTEQELRSLLEFTATTAAEETTVTLTRDFLLTLNRVDGEKKALEVDVSYWMSQSSAAIERERSSRWLNRGIGFFVGTVLSLVASIIATTR